MHYTIRMAARSVLHIDVNSAYLSWTAVELLKNGHPEDIRRTNAAIAGDREQRRGIILAKSESAKRAGVRTAMTVSEALRLCPDLRLYPPDPPLYAVYSDRLYELLSEYSDVIERFSVDECFLDYTGSEKLFGPPAEAAFAISRRVREELGFTVNIGVAQNKFLAKMASEREKPDRVHTLFPEEIEEKMWPLPLREMFGVGRSTENALSRLGLVTIGDVARADLRLLKRELKPALGQLLWDRANGIDDAPVVPAAERELKSIGHSTTTARDVTDEAEALRILLQLSERVGIRLRRAERLAGGVSVELKNADFTVYRHQRKLARTIETTTEIYGQAREIFREMWRGDALRLLGVSVFALSGGNAENESIRVSGLPRQLSLFDALDPGAESPSGPPGQNDGAPAARALEEAQDRIRSRFGKKAITRGTLL